MGGTFHSLRPRFQRLLAWPVRHPYWTLLICVCTTLLLAIPASRIRADNSSDIFQVEDNLDRLFFDQFQQQFGANDFIVVTMTCDELFTHENLRVVQHLTGWLADLPQVEKVTSLADVDDVKGGDADFIVEPFFEEVPEDPDGLLALRERALSKPLYVGGIVSADGNTAGLITDLAAEGMSNAERDSLVEGIRSHLRRLERSNRHFAVAGRKVTDYYLNAYMNRDIGRLMPVSAGLMLLILFFLFRHPYGILLPTLLVGSAVVGGNGALVLVGGTNNMVTSILPPLMMATAIALAIHLLTHYHELLLTAALPMGDTVPLAPVDQIGTGEDTRALLDRWQTRLHGQAAQTEAPPFAQTIDNSIAVWLERLGTIDHLARNNTLIVTHVVQELWRPCLAAALTTMAGFASLGISHVPPIRHFGVAASLGVAYTLVMAFTLLPALLIILRHPISRRRIDPLRTETLETTLGWIGNLVTHHHRPILYLVGGIAVASIAGMLRLRVETNGLAFFFQHSPLVQDTQEVERKLVGTEDLRLSLRATEPEAMAQVETLQLQEELAQWLRLRPGIDKVIDFPDYLKEMNRGFHDDDAGYYVLPDSQELAAQYLLLYDGEDIRDVLSEDHSWAALTVLAHTHAVSELQRLINDTRARLATLPDGIEARVTGNTVLAVGVVKEIMAAQIESLTLASLLIFAMVSLLFLSLRDGLLAMPSNILPILVNLGLMGWLDIPLNPATAMISAVAIGIAVDDTVHFLSDYSSARRRGATPADAIHHTLFVRGRAMVSTSLVLFCAFAVLAVSSFVPVVHFGLLTSVTMISALLADLLFLPALLLSTDR